MVSPAPLPLARTSAQRQAAEPEGLGKEILARTSARAHMPLTDRPRQTGPAFPAPSSLLSRARTVRRTPILARDRLGGPGAQPPGPGVTAEPLPLPGIVRMPLRRAEEAPETAKIAHPQPVRSDLPLPPLMTIQRTETPPKTTIEVGTITTVPGQVLQQKEGAQAPVSETDLNKLARDVYPLIKRMLAVERERRAGRWLS